MSAAREAPDRAVRMREEFDLAFARPAATAGQQVVDLLAIRVAEGAYGLRVDEIRELLTAREVVAVPGDQPALLGLCGVRGRIVPVFSLAQLLGGAAPARPPRWLAVCDAGEAVALAFDQLDRHLRLPATALHADGAAAGTRFVRTAVRTDGQTLPVISIPLVIAAMRGGTEP